MRSKMKMDEWNGRYVRLKRNITRRDGKVCRRGTVYKCGGHWRGRIRLIHLYQKDEINWCSVAVSGVGLNEVRLLPKNWIPL